MEGKIKRVIAGLQTICRCFSVAIRQATEGEIDTPSARRFRRFYEPEEAPPTHRQDTGLGLEELITRAAVGLRTFRDCCIQANRQSRQIEIDIPARRRFREVYEAGGVPLFPSMQGMTHTRATPDYGGSSKPILTGIVPVVGDFQEDRLEELRSNGAEGSGPVPEGEEESAWVRRAPHENGADTSLEEVG